VIHRCGFSAGSVPDVEARVRLKRPFPPTRKRVTISVTKNTEHLSNSQWLSMILLLPAHILQCLSFSTDNGAQPVLKFYWSA
jgi:hypothetical protein